VGPTPSGDPQEVSRRGGGGGGCQGLPVQGGLGDESVQLPCQCLVAVSDFVLAPTTQCCTAACHIKHACANVQCCTVAAAAHLPLFVQLPQGCLSLTWLLHKPESCHNDVSVFPYQRVPATCPKVAQTRSHMHWATVSLLLGLTGASRLLKTY